MTGPHRAWRIVADWAGSGWMACSEIQFRSVPGGPDLTDTVPFSAFSSSSYDATTGPEKAFDNNHATMAHSGTDGGAYIIGVDFGAGNPQSVVEFAWRSRSDTGAYSPAQGTLEYSDDMVSWTPSFVFICGPLPPNTTATFAAPGPPTSHRRWAFRATSPLGGGYTALAEIALASAPGGPNIASGGTVFGTTARNGYTEDRAWDGNPLTEWRSGILPTDFRGILGYLFPSATHVAEVRLQAPPSAATGAPLSGFLLYSDDGKSFGIAHTFSGLSWSGGEVKPFPTGAVGPPQIIKRRRIFFP